MNKVLLMLLLFIPLGCAAPPQAPPKDCGSFDTELLRADLKAPLRTDREWYESIVGELARQLDCERGAMGGRND